MFQAHSYLWHYLWVAPNLVLLFLGLLIWKRGITKQFPAFVAFAFLSAMGQLAVYTADVVPSVSPETFWLVDWISLGIEAILKFVLIAEIFARVFGRYPSIARMGKLLIRGVGVAVTLAAALAAAYTPKDGLFGIVSGAHILEQTVYLIECGLLAFLFVFSSYFHLRWNRSSFGIALGLSISACVHLGHWAVVANAGLSNSTRYQLDFISMATYHVCVLIWCYYLLIPQKPASTSNDSGGDPTLPFSGGTPLDHEEALNNWNRELERLLHQ